MAVSKDKPEWLVRVDDEYVELVNKISKLKTYTMKDEFNKLDSVSQQLMISQLLCMKQYAVILEERVYRAK